MPRRTIQQQIYDERRANNAAKRGVRIVALIEAGRTYAYVARRFGITRARVSQIMRRWAPERFPDWEE